MFCQLNLLVCGTIANNETLCCHRWMPFSAESFENCTHLKVEMPQKGELLLDIEEKAHFWNIFSLICSLFNLFHIEILKVLKKIHLGSFGVYYCLKD